MCRRVAVEHNRKDKDDESPCDRVGIARNGVDISSVEEIRVDLNPDALQEMMQKTNRRTVPQIWIDERWVGGFDDLSALDQSGELNKLLNI